MNIISLLANQAKVATLSGDQIWIRRAETSTGYLVATFVGHTNLLTPLNNVQVCAIISQPVIHEVDRYGMIHRILSVEECVKKHPPDTAFIVPEPFLKAVKDRPGNWYTLDYREPVFDRFGRVVAKGFLT